MFVCVLIQYMCQEDHCRSNQPISLKLDVVIGPTNWKNQLTFGGDPTLDMDYGSLFHLAHHCRMGHFRRFISISHTATGQFS